MKLNDIPTPITDAFADSPAPDGSYELACRQWEIFSQNLERKLNAARNALYEIRDSSSSTRLVRIAKESLELSRP